MTGVLAFGSTAIGWQAASSDFQEEKLRQSHPISDATGVIALGTTGIGWQAASSDFNDTVVAFAVCATPTLGSTVSVQYVSAQDTGLARAFCPASAVVTGGGGFVENAAPAFSPVSLRQTYPISDATVVIAHAHSAIGWQTASSDFNEIVVSIAICASN